MTDIAKAARIEARAQVTIMLIMGITAAFASFTHIHDLSVEYGQPSWIGWANAVVVELMSIAAGLELRRRKRSGQHTGFVYTVLCAAAVVSLAAQVAEAEPSIWGWIVAALPALGFLAVVKIVLSRSPIEHGPDPVDQAPSESGPDAPERFESVVRSATAGSSKSPQTKPVIAQRTGPTVGPHSGPVPLADRTVNSSRIAGEPSEPTEPPSDNTEHGGPTTPRSTRSGSTTLRRNSTAASTTRRRPVRRHAPSDGHSEPAVDLLGIARNVAADLQKSEGKITRNGLARGIRHKGHPIGTDRASDLWRLLQTDGQVVNSP